MTDGGGMRAIVVPLKIGGTAPVELSEADLSVYEAVAECFGGEIVQRPSVTIPISDEQVEDRRYDAYKIVSNAHAEARATKPDLLILDVGGGLVRGPLINSLLAACQTLADGNTELHFAVLLDIDLDERTDMCVAAPLRRLSNHLTRVTPRSVTGPLLARNAKGALNLPPRLARLRGSPQDRLRSKLIRRVGHFKRGEGATARCAAFYYDGSHCEKEIAELLANAVSGLSVSPLTALFHGPQSPWLGEVALIAEATFLKCLSLLAIPTPMTIEGDAVLVLDMIDTGATARAIVETLKQHLTGSLSVITVLTTRLESSIPGHISLHGDASHPLYQVRYLHQVKQRVVASSDCRHCKARLAADSLTETTHQISALAMWAMLEGIELGDEEDSPPSRTPMRGVPRFRALFLENGPWLASLLLALLAQKTQVRPQDCLFVCPNQPGALGIAHFLQEVYRLTVVRIPDNRLTSGKSGEEMISAYAEESWMRAIRGGATNNVVFFDEFTRSGDTLQSLCRLLAVVGRTLVAALPLVDLGDSSSRHDVCVSLYQVQLAHE